MASTTGVFKGVVRGRFIELERAVNLPDGEQVTVVVHTLQNEPRLPAGEGLRRSFGSWADDAEGVDKFLEQLRTDRDRDDRPEQKP
jgi:hypothetical protein